MSGVNQDRRRRTSSVSSVTSINSNTVDELIIGAVMQEAVEVLNRDRRGAHQGWQYGRQGQQFPRL